MKPTRTQRLAIISGLATLFLMLSYGFLRMPAAGVLPHPAYNETTRRILANTERDTNAPNVVNSVLADYRAFDTLGEAAVLFVGITSVATVLISRRDRERHG